MRLSLGTPQLGLCYGVNNTTGMLDPVQAYEVLHAAHDAGFTMVDTSTDYGDALDRIGNYLRYYPGAFDVVAKYHGTLPAEKIRELKAHCDMRIPGGVGHHVLWTAGATNIAELDPDLAEGVTVYTVEEAESVPDGFSMIQVPASILDGRMDEEIKELQKRGKTVFVRSMLLQGLIAADPATGPAGTNGNPKLKAAAAPYLEGLRGVAEAYDMSVVELAVRWAWEIFPDVVIFGAETPEQAHQIGEYWGRGALPEGAVSAARVVRKGIPELVISPRMWKQTYDFTVTK